MNYTIQFWRWFFTLVICMLHFEPQYFEGEQPIFKCGYLAVEFFFILSGFFLMRHVERSEESAFQYSVSRVKSLYPTLVFSWILLIANLAIIRKYSLIEILKEIKLHIWEYLLMNATGVTWDILNGVTWYISALIIVGYFVYWLVKWNKKIFLGLIAPFAILLIYQYYIGLGNGLDYHLAYARLFMGSLNRAMGGLSIGCLTYEACKRVSKRKLTIWGKFCVNIFEMLVIVGLFDIMFYGEKNSNNLLVLIGFPVLIIIEWNGWTLLSKILNKKVFNILGKASLVIYTNQVLLIGIFISKFCKRRGYLLDSIEFLLLMNLFGIVGKSFLDKICRKLPKVRIIERESYEER